MNTSESGQDSTVESGSNRSSEGPKRAQRYVSLPINSPGFQLFTRVGNPIFASYLGHLPTYLLFLVDFLRKTNLPTYYKSSYFQ